MIERHYDDEALISLIENNRATADPHLPNCPPCSAKIESFQMISDALCDQDMWDITAARKEPVPATIASLRAFADHMSDEDTRAEAILQELLAGSREEWMPRLEEHPEWRMAGVVRKLIDRTYSVVVSMPPDAVAMMTVATNIADQLNVADYPSDTVARLRGAAWRDKAYALFYVGQFSDAEAALFVSERHFCSCLVNEYELARMNVVRALVLRPLARLQEAVEAAEYSASTFLKFADANRTVAAQVTKAQLLFSRERFDEAVTLLDAVERRFHAEIDVPTHVVVLNNLAYAYRKTGEVDLAMSYYDMVTAIYEERGMATETARARWNVAAIAAGKGDLGDALRRFEQVARDFDDLGMTSESALVSLDRAEILLSQGRFDDVERLCRHAISLFERAGLTYTTRALTALAFMQEAARKKTADLVLVREVREYLRRLPSQPNLLFAHPPLAVNSVDF
jgi:tetratricopeptide (TPR) repeat protein